MTSLDLTICKASEVPKIIAERDAINVPFDAVISIEHPCDTKTSFEQGRAPRLAQLVGSYWGERQLILECWDIEEPVEDVPVPDLEIVRSSLTHFDKWRQKDRPTRILTHCRSGRARSTAIGLVLTRYILGHGSEEKSLAALLRVRPIAVPNIAIVRHGDHLLDCRGALIRVVENDAEMTFRRKQANATRAHQLESRRVVRPTP